MESPVKFSGNMPGDGVGAVVLGGDYQGLGIVQSLGRRGVPVCVIDDELSISRFSRYITHAVKVPDLRDKRMAVDALLAVSRRLGLKGWVVYPTRDETVAALSQYRGVLGEYLRVSTPEWETIQWVWDKRNTYRLARDLGIAVPQTWHSTRAGELDSLEVEFPVVIKPAIKEHFFYATRAKAWRANDRKQMKELFRRAAKQTGEDEVMIQELIPGDGRQQFAWCAFFKQDHAVGSMAVRRSRQHPREFGRASTFVETTEIPLLKTSSLRFLRAIDYYGLVELEYKLDPRDGQDKLLDVNARTWGYHTLGRTAGVDFPLMFFADQLGLPVEPQRGRPGVSWVRLVTDFLPALTEIFAGHLDWRAYGRYLCGARVEAVFTHDDPLPGIAELALFPYLVIRRGY